MVSYYLNNILFGYVIIRKYLSQVKRIFIEQKYINSTYAIIYFFFF